MKHEKKVQKRRHRRQMRVRSGLYGMAERPRLVVFRSNQNFSCQAIDDDAGRTLFSISTNSKAFREVHGRGNTVAAAAKLGTLAASGLKAAGITKVQFDRRRYHYHGRVKAFADKLREGEIHV